MSSENVGPMCIHEKPIGSCDICSGNTTPSVEDEVTRGAKEAEAFLKEAMPTDEISEKIVKEGNDLLASVIKMASSHEFTDDTIQKFLQAVSADTSFDGANIEVRLYEKFGTKNLFEGTKIQQIGKEPGKYNVWFERKDEQWTLACNKIPVGGSLRGADDDGQEPNAAQTPRPTRSATRSG